MRSREWKGAARKAAAAATAAPPPPPAAGGGGDAAKEEEDLQEEANSKKKRSTNSKLSVRKSVEYICGVVALAGIRLAAEDLRRAKFDDASSARPILLALHSLLRILQPSSATSSAAAAAKSIRSISNNKIHPQQQRQPPSPSPSPSPKLQRSESCCRSSRSSTPTPVTSGKLWRHRPPPPSSSTASSLYSAAKTRPSSSSSSRSSTSIGVAAAAGEASWQKLLHPLPFPADNGAQPPELMLEAVKLELRRWDYPLQAPIFSSATTASNSRPLLLAMAWLLSSLDVVGNILRQSLIQPLLRSLSKAPLPPYPEDDLEFACNSEALGAGEAAERDARAAMAAVRATEAGGAGQQQQEAALMQMWGRVEMCARKVRLLRECKAKLRQQLKMEMENGGGDGGGDNDGRRRRQLSEYDIFLLRHPSALRRHLRSLQSYHAIQRIFSERRTHETLFYQWMLSVTAADRAEAETETETGQQSAVVLLPPPPPPPPVDWLRRRCRSEMAASASVSMNGRRRDAERFVDEYWKFDGPSIRKALLRTNGTNANAANLLERLKEFTTLLQQFSQP